MRAWGLALAYLLVACGKPRTRSEVVVAPEDARVAPPTPPMLASSYCDFLIRCGRIARSQRVECEQKDALAANPEWQPRECVVRSTPDGAAPAREGEECVNAGCAPGLVCRYDFTHKPRNVCVRHASEGSACEFWNHCTDGLTCVGLEEINYAVGPLLHKAGKCEPWRDVGEPCVPESLRLQHSGCPESTRCDEQTATCVRRS